jgi:diguanylate cyclase (GGDEF)-like protein
MNLGRILLVDDDLGSIKLMSRMLDSIADVQFALNGVDAIRLASDSPPSLILLDAQMPGMSGFRVCEALKADPRLAEVPVIFVTSHSEPDFEIAGFDIGAVDFIAKPVSAPLLVARVKTQLRLSALTAELRRNATTDGLTSVANRRHFDESMQKEWLRARRTCDPISVVMVDVDHFKLYNDRYGHPAGDLALQKVAQCLLQACLRPGDVVARYGGEEFILILPGTPRAGAQNVAARIGEIVESSAIPHVTSPTSGHLTVSIGVSTFDEQSLTSLKVESTQETKPCPETAYSIPRLLRAADLALYAAKSHGRAQAWVLDITEADTPERARELLSRGPAGKLVAR